MARFVRLVGMQHTAGIGVEHDRRVGWSGGGFVFAVPRLMRSMRGVTGSMARGGRMDCSHNGENAGKTNVNTQPFAHARMISFQLQSPVSQYGNNSPVAGPFPTPNANFPGVPPRQALPPRARPLDA